MSFALLFAGQGTQNAAMLPWLEAEPASQSALVAMQRAIDTDWRIALADNSMRSSNAFAQPLITGTSLATWAGIHHHLCNQVNLECSVPGAMMPVVVAGYSVGELAAFACAQVLDVQAALTLATLRANAMDSAVQGLNTGLLTVAGMEMQSVLQMDDQLDCAIHIGDDHGIYAGKSALLDACSIRLTAIGATCKRLDVRIASHSRWMVPAAAQFSAALPLQNWSMAQCPVVLNATGTATRQTQALQRGLSDQLCITVQWAACMDAIAEKGVRCVMEIGAGNALANMWNARHAAIPARSAEDFRDASGAARWIARQIAM